MNVNTPKLTVGFSCYEDYHGAVFTIQALRLYHSEVIGDIELIVIDQTQGGKSHQQMLQTFVTGWVATQSDTAGTRYIHAPQPQGTSPGRHRLFKEAASPYVLCIDSHVLLYPGSLARLIAYYEENPDTNDLLQGPMVLDNLTSIASHFDPVWRAEMYGVWGTDDYFADPENPPREIPMQGLGLFSGRKERWLELGGFNERFRGFGGEEGYIHEKYRQAGGKTLGLPFLRWWHRFGRPEGATYGPQRWDKVRNYIIGWSELGKDLTPIKEHFLSGGLSESDWDHILECVEKDIYPMPRSKKANLSHVAQQRRDNKGETPAHLNQSNFAEADSGEGCGGCPGGLPQPPEGVSLLSVLDWATGHPRDLNEHLRTIAYFASKCDHVTEFSTRRESTVALVAPKPKTVISYNLEQDKLQDRLHELIAKDGEDEITPRVETFTTHVGKSLEVPPIEETDLLFIDTVHSGSHLWQELQRHGNKVRKYIVLHDTALYGEKGEDGGPGLLPAVRRWCGDFPEWRVVYHTDNQYGLTVLSKTEAPPSLPSVPKMAWNYANALAKHKASGSGMADEETVEIRLGTCAGCSLRDKNRCTKCGCYLDSAGGKPGKALLQSSECPLGYWKEAEAKGQAIIPLTMDASYTFPPEKQAADD